MASPGSTLDVSAVATLLESNSRIAYVRFGVDASGKATIIKSDSFPDDYSKGIDELFADAKADLAASTEVSFVYLPITFRHGHEGIDAPVLLACVPASADGAATMAQAEELKKALPNVHAILPTAPGDAKPTYRDCKDAAEEAWTSQRFQA